MTAKVGHDVGDIEGHFRHGAVLDHLAIDVGPHLRLADIDTAYNARTNRTKPVLTLDPQHRARIRIAEILCPYIVGSRKACQMVPHVGRSHIAHRLADNGRDLALIVEILTVGGPGHLTTMGIEGGQRLLEIGRGGQGRGLELHPARFIVQVDTDDLARITGRQIDRAGLSNPSAIAKT